ncbi:hypothetical protein DQ353_16445 [Arthrobacter sp. AQ5-05]|nr:hypothetical protein DQ353_16445 [Arthrobacter sp. AQ5-05]
MWPQHKVEVYERMVAELRRTLEGQSQDIAPHVRERLEEIIQGAVHTIETGAEIVAVGLPDLAPEPVDLAPVEPAVVELAAAEPEPAEPAPAAAKPASDPFRHGAHAEANRLTKARELARWLWDRNISGEQVLGFTNKWRNKIARAAGVNPPSTLETWTVAVDLMTRMEELAASGTQPEASERHHLDEHEQWATEG